MPRLDPAVLALENGHIFEGTAFGATGRVDGEVVFNTSMTGYQEVLTDPSYYGQIVAMTAPQIGNTGINEEDPESERPWLSGFIAREFARRHSSHRATGDLHTYLEQHGVVGLQGIDTALTALLDVQAPGVLPVAVAQVALAVHRRHHHIARRAGAGVMHRQQHLAAGLVAQQRADVGHVQRGAAVDRLDDVAFADIQVGIGER